MFNGKRIEQLEREVEDLKRKVENQRKIHDILVENHIALRTLLGVKKEPEYGFGGARLGARYHLGNKSIRTNPTQEDHYDLRVEKKGRTK